MDLELKLLAILGIVAALLFGFNRFVAGERAAGAATCEVAHAKADQIEGDRRVAAQLAVVNEAGRMGARRQDEATSLAAADRRLRDRFAAAVQPVRDPAAAPGCAAASAAAGVCAELLGKAGDRLRILAATADAYHDAGTACVSAYDSLTTPLLK